MKIARILKYLGAVWLLSVALPAHAAFMNGDFSAGATGWTDASGSGSVSFVGGSAELVTGAGADAFSASIIQGADASLFDFSTAFTLDTNVTTLTFDAIFSSTDLLCDPLVIIDTCDESVGLFTDSLTVSLFDKLDLTLDLVFLDVDGPSASLGLDVSSLAGRDVALAFDLSDENDGFDTTVQIDNVVFNTAAATVPEPGMLLLMSFGLLAMFGAGGARRKMHNSGSAS